jgi:hypothetical protein
MATCKFPAGIDMQVRNAQGSTSSNNQAKRGMVLPFQPLSLAFSHVNYYVDMPAVSHKKAITIRKSSLGEEVKLLINPCSYIG